MFSDSQGDGLAVVLEHYWDGNTPFTQSEDDPDQGWKKCKGKGVRIDEPVHFVYDENGKLAFSRTDATKELEAVSTGQVDQPKPLL
jgi:hypothetical protein